MLIDVQTYESNPTEEGKEKKGNVAATTNSFDQLKNFLKDIER